MKQMYIHSLLMYGTRFKIIFYWNLLIQCKNKHNDELLSNTAIGSNDTFGKHVHELVYVLDFKQGIGENDIL